ncbi:MAG: ADP-ribosylglycohydrolase family protein [Fusobacteriaceae bacterium]|jgi:ADP-ribosylglycohydrolase/O-acetyl-ADP-ribose deacetylase (regulator of RNase III)|nr:ADP-ribosylglycohydrolase family protein [Fusobacteriaceae bacterium]
MLNSKNGIIGLIIGDALGVPVEFCTRDELLKKPVVHMVGFGSHNVPKGTWSDDSSMTIATIDSLISKGRIDESDIADKFMDWVDNANYTATGILFDIGRTTIISLRRYSTDGISAQKSGGDKEFDNGNGSLMRILPLAYYFYAKKSKKNVILDGVKLVSSITHRHEISVLACYIYTLYAIELLSGATKEDAYDKIKNEDYSYFSPDTVTRYNRILKNNIKDLKLNEIKSSGYVVDTLEATLWAILNSNSYNQAVVLAVNLGEDTDTVGACTGGLAGILYGIRNILSEWKIDLIKYNYLKELCAKFDVLLNKLSCTFGNNNNIFKSNINLRIINGDITSTSADAVVNAARTSLLGGGGVDGAIHRAAGVELLEKCRELNGCGVGEAKITDAYNFPAKYIIHTVAPIWDSATVQNKEKLLENCYKNSLSLAEDYDIKSIAFPCLGMGAYRCPLEVGTKIAIDTVINYCKNIESNLDEVIFVCFEKHVYDYYCRYFNDIAVEENS